MAEPAKKKDPLAKYERMKKLGLPMASIVHKMKGDGIEQSVIDSWAGVSSTDSESKSSEDVVRLAAVPSGKMKPFHWTKVNRTSTSSTVWEGVADNLHKIKLDTSTLSTLFAATTAKTVGTPRSGGGSDTGVLDPKRCHQVMLGIKSMGLTSEQILDAIMDMDDAVLPPDKVQSLIPLAPTDGELQMLREYVKTGADISELNDAERFFVSLFDLVAVRQMLRLWLLKSDFEPRVAHLRAGIKTVRDTLQALKSERLKMVLSYILAVGNFMNNGTHRGDAWGFHLETLDLIDGLKGADRNTTLLAYVVSQLNTLAPSALEWVSELEGLENAARVTTAGVQREVDELKRDLEELDKRINAHKRTMTKAHSDWARDGAVVGLPQFASHIRKASRSLSKAGGAAAAWAELSSYSTLRLPMGKLTDAELSTDMFQKTMYKFCKRAKSVVSDVQSEYRGTEQLCRDLSLYFGCDEDTSWEELFLIFAHFRNRFIKAQRDVAASTKKAASKKSSKRKAAALEESLKSRPTESKYASAPAATGADAAGGAAAGGTSSEDPVSPQHRRGRGGADAKRALEMYGSLESSSGATGGYQF